MELMRVRARLWGSRRLRMLRLARGRRLLEGTVCVCVCVCVEGDWSKEEEVAEEVVVVEEKAIARA